MGNLPCTGSGWSCFGAGGGGKKEEEGNRRKKYFLVGGDGNDETGEMVGANWGWRR